MFKKTLILLLSSFITIVGAPDFLLASDDVDLAGVDNSKIVKTVIPETKTVSTQTTARAATVNRSVATASPAPVAANRLNLAGRSLPVEYTNNTAVNAGSVVKFYNNKFLYGHNSAGVFGFLPSVGIGTVFSLTYNGVTTNYRVSNKVEYAKTGPTTLENGGVTYKMARIANGFSPDGVHHSISIMTCSGVSYGNGDASHRLVLFADAI